MSYIKRAFIYNWRNPKKAINFLLLVILLSSVIGATIFINQAVMNTEQNLLNQLPPTATIQVDVDEASEMWRTMGFWPALSLTPHQIRNIADLPYVREYDIFSTQLFYSFSLTPFERLGRSSPGDEHFGYRWLIRSIQNPNIRDIQEGHIELVYGRTFTATEVDDFYAVTLISEDVATQNNLVVGSTISLTHVIRSSDELVDGDFAVFGEESYDLEVVGIFRPLVATDSIDILLELDNRIYVPNSFIELAGQVARAIRAEHGETTVGQTIHFENVFTLYSSHDLPAFREAAASMTPNQFVVHDAGNPFQDIAASMQTMIDMATMILYLTVGAAIFIFSLLITLFLHGRKREIGIYLSVGVKKSHILLQFVLEVVIIAGIGIIIALFTGRFISEILSYTMLMDGMMVYHEFMHMGFGMDSLMQMGFQVDLNMDDLLAGYRFNLDLELVITFLVVGIGTAIVSTIVPLIYVFRLDPKKILM